LHGSLRPCGRRPLALERWTYRAERHSVDTVFALIVLLAVPALLVVAYQLGKAQGTKIERERLQGR